MLSNIDILKKEISQLKEEVDRLSAQEQAVKIVLNGGYGATGNVNFRYFDPTIAEGITATGQVAIRYITKKVNEHLNKEIGTVGVDYVVSSDTDSIYYRIQELVDLKWPHITDKQELTDAIDEYAETVINPYFDKCFEELAVYMNAMRNLLDMKREAIADCFIIRAKKNYIMRVLDNEGVRFAEPYYKMMGIEVAKTSTPMIVRENLKKALIIVIDGTNGELVEHYKQFRKFFLESELNKIARPIGISDIDKYQNEDYSFKEYEYVYDEKAGRTVKKKVSIPFHVKAAILHNRLVKEMKLQNKYEYIKNSTKIKLLPLKEPNPLKSDVIGFIGELPPEFGLDEYVDRSILFDKVYKGPLESFTVFNSWSLEPNSMSDVFGQIDIASVAIAKKSIKKPKSKKNAPTTSLF